MVFECQLKYSNFKNITVLLNKKGVPLARGLIVFFYNFESIFKYLIAITILEFFNS